VSSDSTSPLLRHTESCYHIRKSKGKTKGTLNFQGSNQVDCDVIRKSEGYDQRKCIEIIAKMIIAHELPLIVCRIQTLEDGINFDNTQPKDDYFSFIIENQIEESPKIDLEIFLEENVLVVKKWGV
jgi:hypothetical protein